MIDSFRGIRNRTDNLNGRFIPDDLYADEPECFEKFSESYELNRKEGVFAKEMICARLNDSAAQITQKMIVETFGNDYGNADILEEQLHGFGFTIV